MGKGQSYFRWNRLKGFVIIVRFQLVCGEGFHPGTSRLKDWATG